MASVLQVIGAIERIANDAVDIARIVTHRLGIPRELVADLSNGRGGLAPGARPRGLAHGPPAAAARSSCPWPPACGSWPSAATATGSPTSTATRCCVPGDVLFLRGSAGRHRPAPRAGRRALLGAAASRPRTARSSDLDRAVDVLVEMKNISEVAVGLAYSALVFRDQGLAAEVRHLEDRLDEMKDRLELWVLRAGAAEPRPVAAARPAAPVAGGRGHRRRRPSRWCGSSRRARSSTRSSASRSASPTRSSCGCRSRAGSRADGATLARAAARHRARASTCSRCAAAAGTSTGPGAACSC